MKTFAIILSFCWTILARPYPQIQQNSQQAQILRNDFVETGVDGRYTLDVETSDGFKNSVQGGLLTIPEIQPEPFLVVHGSYQYLGPDNQMYTVEYVADQEGFHPAGPHLSGAGTSKDKPRKLGIPSAALASLTGGGLG